MFQFFQSFLNQFFLLGDVPLNVETGTYVPSLILLSYVIATLGSFTGLRLASDMHNAPTEKIKSQLHLGGAFAFGTGIWSMHFIGMLAYKMDMKISYDPVLTILSMLIAVFVAYGVLQIIRSKVLNISTLFGSAILLGAAICGMHYTGMAAMEMDGDLRYKPFLFSLSVLIAVVASGAALWIVFMLGQHKGRRKLALQIIAAFVMGAAICGMHYAGIAASVFLPYADCRYNPNQSFTGLALAVTIASTVIFVIALVLGFQHTSSDIIQKNKATYSGNAVFFHLALLLSVFLILITSSYVFLNETLTEQKNDQYLLGASSLQRTLITRYIVRTSIIVSSQAQQDWDEVIEHTMGMRLDKKRIEENYDAILNGGLIDLSIDKDHSHGGNVHYVGSIDDRKARSSILSARQAWEDLKALGGLVLQSNVASMVADPRYETFEEQLFETVEKQNIAVQAIQDHLNHVNNILDLKQKIILALGALTFFLSLLYARFFIANRIQAEQKKLQESEERYTLATQGATAGIWDWDIIMDQLQWAGTAHEIFDAKPHENLPKNAEEFFDTVHQEDVNALRQGIRDHFEQGNEFRAEFRIITYTGHMKWIRSKAMALKDENGEPYRMAGSFEDITQEFAIKEELNNHRHNLENLVQEKTQDLLDEKKRTEAIIDNMNDGLITINQQGSVLSFNKGAEKIFGCTQQDIVHKNIKALMPSPYKDEHDEYLQHYLKTGEKKVLNTTRELEGQKTDGTVFPLALSVTKIDFDHEPLFIGIVQDITEQKQKEQDLLDAKHNAERLNKQMQDYTDKLELARFEAEDANRAKSDFLANMSHEIRTPMNAVLGMSNLLLDTELNEEQKEWARSIYLSGENLLNIINDIIDISKIEAGKLTLEKTNFDFPALIQEVASMYTFQAREKGLEMLLNFDDALPQMFIGDPVRIKQIFANLISNALKFTAQGHVLIEIKQMKQTKNTVQLECHIEDTGIGIPKEKQKRIFQKFSQAEESTTRKFGGTGLGLTIVSELLEMMGGKINVKSKEGEGSCFIFTMKLEKSDVKEPAEIDEDITNLRALIVDDYDLTRTMLKTTLERHGIACDTAVSAEKALKTLKGNRDYDICLIDYALKGMDGLKLVDNLRANRKFDDIILLMVSGAMENKPYEELKDMGLQGYLKKPFRQDQIINGIKLAIRNRDLGEEAMFITRHNATKAESDQALDASPKYEQYPDKNVLVVEDMKMNMTLITKVLSKFGIDADKAENGAEALDKMKAHHYDIVLMDCQMPEMDGFESTRETRKFEKQNNKETVPIVALTADAMVGDREKCIAAGMNDYINKPFKESDIANILRKWL